MERTITAGDATRALRTRYVSRDSERNPCIEYLASVRVASRRVVRARLDAIASLAGHDAGCESFPWSRLDAAIVGALSRAVADRYAPATARACAVALRGVLRAGWRAELYSLDECHRRESAIVRPSGSRLPRGREIGSSEVSAMYRLARPRDRALLALLFGAGLRRSEACAVTWGRFDGSSIRVDGKGDKQRDVPLPWWAVDALRRWEGPDGGMPADMSILDLTPAGLYDALRRLARRAGVVEISPHDARRTYVSELLDVADVATVARLVGHASTEQTRRYDRRGERAAREAVAKLRSPG